MLALIGFSSNILTVMLNTTTKRIDNEIETFISIPVTNIIIPRVLNLSPTESSK